MGVFYFIAPYRLTNPHAHPPLRFLYFTEEVKSGGEGIFQGGEEEGGWMKGRGVSIYLFLNCLSMLLKRGYLISITDGKRRTSAPAASLCEETF